jgi:hypothetical protein
VGEEIISAFASTAGGVMTEEAGAVTGDLELLTRPTGDGTLATLVRYAGAGEWYAVSGSPTSVEGGPREAHKEVLRRLTTPGAIEAGNELPVDLTGIS